MKNEEANQAAAMLANFTASFANAGSSKIAADVATHILGGLARRRSVNQRDAKKAAELGLIVARTINQALAPAPAATEAPAIPPAADAPSKPQPSPAD